MHYNIIGAGRLGKNIAQALSTIPDLTLKSICNSRYASAQKACLDLGFGTAVKTLEELVKADVIWITSNDNAIASIVASLARNLLKPGCLVIHCSGALSSEVLHPLKEKGCFIASIHPLKAFQSTYLATNAFTKVYCIMEGDIQACNWLNTLFSHLGAIVLNINAKSKKMYHAAATIASNYLITLAACGEQLLTEAGISQPDARLMLCHLMQGNLNSLLQTDRIADSLTGPLMRGDNETIALHLQAIQDPLVNNLYKAAGLATLPITNLTNEQKAVMKQLFESEYSAERCLF